MTFELTPAVERAFAAAAMWTSRDDGNGLAPPELLLGLLSEAESRAAGMLAARGVTSELVQSRWPCLRPVAMPQPGRASQWSTDVEISLAAAAERLNAFPRPLVLATEHVLLGLVAGEHELSDWLVERGFSAGDLEAEIHRLYGIERESESAERGARSAELDVPLSPFSFSLSPPLLPSSPFPLLPSATPPLFRLLDASANRAREGLRVVEDYVRFALDEMHLTGELKQMRHSLTEALARLPASELLAARDTQADVGCELTTAGERARPDLASVLTANFKRLQESLRSLEEYGKVFNAELATELEQLRYRSYTLERAVELTRAGIERLAGVRLYVLVNGGSSVCEFETLAASLVAAGVGVIQLRDKRLADRELLSRGRRLRELTRATGTLFIMNDRPDLAALAAADGVHLGQEELMVHDARAIVGTGMLVGVSTHSLAQARAAVLDGASYIGVGPTFASGTKAFDAAQLTGLELLRAVAAEIRLPAFAIGGIDKNNLPDVLAAGFTRVAVSGAIAAATDPAGAARELLRKLADHD